MVDTRPSIRSKEALPLSLFVLDHETEPSKVSVSGCKGPVGTRALQNPQTHPAVSVSILGLAS